MPAQPRWQWPHLPAGAPRHFPVRPGPRSPLCFLLSYKPGLLLDGAGRKAWKLGDVNLSGLETDLVVGRQWRLRLQVRKHFHFFRRCRGCLALPAPTAAGLRCRGWGCTLRGTAPAPRQKVEAKGICPHLLSGAWGEGPRAGGTVAVHPSPSLRVFWCDSRVTLGMLHAGALSPSLPPTPGENGDPEPRPLLYRIPGRSPSPCRRNAMCWPCPGPGPHPNPHAGANDSSMHPSTWEGGKGA